MVGGLGTFPLSKYVSFEQDHAVLLYFFPLISCQAPGSFVQLKKNPRFCVFRSVYVPVQDAFEHKYAYVLKAVLVCMVDHFTRYISYVQ